MNIGTRLKASAHEMRCWECRVTWTSWAQRLIGLKRGYTPRLSKTGRALVERARRAEAAVERAERLRDKWLTYPPGDMHHGAGLMLARYLSGEAFGPESASAPNSPQEGA